MILSMNSCVKDIARPENKTIEIVKTYIELDRFENELFIQVETNQQTSQELIQNVFVKLTYIGDDIHEYSNIFQLYDNAINGDLIPSNGIYTLLTLADTVVLPDIEPKIIEINMPNNFQLHQTESDSMDISFNVLGKKYSLESKVIDIYDVSTPTETIINLDNSEILIEVNSDYMFKDFNKLEDGVCDRTENQNPNQNNFIPYVILNKSNPKNEYSNHFVFNFKVPFFSLSACGSTGKAIFRVILHDLDTNSEIIVNDIEFIIYGCGDGYCTSEVENVTTCQEDCQ